MDEKLLADFLVHCVVKGEKDYIIGPSDLK